jgi:hypothetical protein
MVPKGIGDLCCGTPWKSKGLTEGYNQMSTQSLSILEHYSLPIISDATSCTEGLMELTDGTDLQVIDALEFIADRVLPSLTIKEKIPSVALHPTCSGVQIGLNDVTYCRISSPQSLYPRKLGMLRIRWRPRIIASRTHKFRHCCGGEGTSHSEIFSICII